MWISQAQRQEQQAHTKQLQAHNGVSSFSSVLGRFRSYLAVGALAAGLLPAQSREVDILNYLGTTAPGEKPDLALCSNQPSINMIRREADSDIFTSVALPFSISEPTSLKQVDCMMGVNIPEFRYEAGDLLRLSIFVSRGPGISPFESWLADPNADSTENKLNGQLLYEFEMQSYELHGSNTRGNLMGFVSWVPRNNQEIIIPPGDYVAVFFCEHQYGFQQSAAGPAVQTFVTNTDMYPDWVEVQALQGRFTLNSNPFLFRMIGETAELEMQPELTIERGPGNDVTVTVTASNGNWDLLSTPEFKGSATVWSVVDQEPTAVNVRTNSITDYTFIMPSADAKGFFGVAKE